MKRVLLTMYAFILLALPFSACGEDMPVELTVEQLMVNAEKYNGDVVVVTGFYFDGWEIMVLCEGLKYSGHAEGHISPEGPMMWFEGGMPREIYDGLYVQSMMGPEERYGKVKVTGKFETGSDYGHLGSHHSRITPQEVELLPWSPPERE